MSTLSLNTNKPCIYLLLGSNLGKRKYQIDKAKALIQSLIGDIISESSIYETQPWGNLDQKSFLNQAVGIKSQLTPEQMSKDYQTIFQGKVFGVVSEDSKAAFCGQCFQDFAIWVQDMLLRGNREIHKIIRSNGKTSNRAKR